MIDALMAVFITLVGIAALLAVMPVGWGLASKSDMRSRAVEIMHRELENIEMLIMNPCNSVNITADKTVCSSGNGAALANTGDRCFAVHKEITQSGTGWVVTVQVKWNGTTTGVSEGRLVTRQDDYKDNANCVSNSQQVAY